MRKELDESLRLAQHGGMTVDADLIPEDLYIPPDALIVILQAFTGPLDLLLYLIRRQNLDILDIPIAEVTKQYMSYIDMMTTARLELAGDYLVMSATLAQIKSNMLLPRPREATDEEPDPRAELVRRLLEYEQFKNAAGDLDQLPRLDRDVYPVHASFDEHLVKAIPSPVEMRELLVALSDVLDRARLVKDYEVSSEPLSVAHYMNLILERIQRTKEFVSFHEIIGESIDRTVIVVNFLAILELVKAGHLALVQREPFAPIFLGAVAHAS